MNSKAKSKKMKPFFKLAPTNSLKSFKCVLPSSSSCSSFPSYSFPHRRVGPTVETCNGTVEGRRIRLKDGRYVNVFLGIPYAKPPVGELRFKKPEPLTGKWDGILCARRYRNRSVQKDFFWDFFTDLRVGKSEDCLHLNVIAPAAASPLKEGYAVMVYIHGGGFVMDSAAKYHYENIARTLVKHDVIVVTVQYRLGYLGYFCTGDENSRGNYGIWDQIAALHWIRANISRFGGNAQRVTVFGQSAGAASADILSLAPASRDLIEQVILMGGNAETIWAVAQKEHLVDYCRQKALKLGFCPAHHRKSPPTENSKLFEQWSREDNARMMQFLRKQPADKFEGTMIGEKSVLCEMRIPIAPVIDGDLLPKPISELRAEAKTRRVIAGVSEFEGLLFLALGLQKANIKFLNFCEDRAYQLLKRAKVDAQSGGESEITMERFRELYGISEETRKDKRLVRNACVEIASDLVNNFALENYCRKMAGNGSTVWRYVFEHFNADSTMALNAVMPFQGATHCTELIYLFDVNIFVVPFRRNARDKKVREMMTKWWTNFAKFGDPNQSSVNDNGAGSTVDCMTNSGDYGNSANVKRKVDESFDKDEKRNLENEDYGIDVGTVIRKSNDCLENYTKNVNSTTISSGYGSSANTVDAATNQMVKNDISKIHEDSLRDSGVSSQESSFHNSYSSDSFQDQSQAYQQPSSSNEMTKSESDKNSDLNKILSPNTEHLKNDGIISSQSGNSNENSLNTIDFNKKNLPSATVSEMRGNCSGEFGICWPPITAENCRAYLALSAQPKVCTDLQAVWRRVEELAPLVDRTPRDWCNDSEPISSIRL